MKGVVVIKAMLTFSISLNTLPFTHRDYSGYSSSATKDPPSGPDQPTEDKEPVRWCGFARPFVHHLARDALALHARSDMHRK